MKKLTRVLIFVLLLAITKAAAAQATPAATAPVAYVYVTSAPTSSTYEINAYTTSSSGVLTKVSGSPFATKGQYMAVSPKWLFDTNGSSIYSFAILSNGALKAGPAMNASGYSPGDGGVLNLFADRPGTHVYDGMIYIDGANNGYQAFTLISNTGQLDFNGNVKPYNEQVDTPLSFVSSNTYAYGANCFHSSSEIYGYKRGSTGKLTALNINPKIPPTGKPNSAYCTYLSATDASGHVAISMTPYDIYTKTGPTQIAVYTASSTGSLTTTSTASNMPSTTINVGYMSASPSGKYLAVSGSNGLQVFHFNGASPLTKLGGVVTTSSIAQVAWDNAGHLYAISAKSGRLYVYSVTSSSVKAAPGWPHAISKIQNLAVLAK